MLSRWSRWIGLALIGGGIAVTACGDDGASPDDDGGEGGDGDSGKGASAGKPAKGGMSTGGSLNAAGNSTGGSSEGGSQPSGGTQSTAGAGGEGDAPSVGGTSGNGNTGGTSGGTSGSGNVGESGSGGEVAGAGGAAGAGGTDDPGPAGGTGGTATAGTGGTATAGTGGTAGSGGTGGTVEPPVIGFTGKATPNDISLAPGGVNFVTVSLTSTSNVPLSVALTARAPSGLTATPASETIVLPANGSLDAKITLRGTDVSTGTGGLSLEAIPTPNGTTDLTFSKTIGVAFSDDLARNLYPEPLPTTENPTPAPTFPHAIASSFQQPPKAGANQWPRLAFDGPNDGSGDGTFWVSYGTAKGEGPTPDHPEWLGVDFGAPVSIRSVTIVPRNDRGPRDYVIQVSNDNATWEAVGDPVVDAQLRGTLVTTLTTAVTRRYVRAFITRSHDPGGVTACPAKPCDEPRNAQIRHFEVRP